MHAQSPMHVVACMNASSEHTARTRRLVFTLPGLAFEAQIEAANLWKAKFDAKAGLPRQSNVCRKQLPRWQ